MRSNKNPLSMAKESGLQEDWEAVSPIDHRQNTKEEEEEAEEAEEEVRGARRSVWFVLLLPPTSLPLIWWYCFCFLFLVSSSRLLAGNGAIMVTLYFSVSTIWSING